MTTKQFKISLRQNNSVHQNSDVAEWFLKMNRSIIPASIEYFDNGSRKIDTVGLSHSVETENEDDTTLILHTIFERYKMKEGGEGAFCDKSPIASFDDFRQNFVVDEI